VAFRLLKDIAIISYYRSYIIVECTHVQWVTWHVQDIYIARALIALEGSQGRDAMSVLVEAGR
jgi:hypothetical protein